MLARSLDLAGSRRVLLHKALVLDAEVLDAALAELKLHSHLVAFFLGRFVFGEEDVFVDLDFFFALLHGHLELRLAVLKSVHAVSLDVDGVAELFDLEFHAVVGHERAFLRLDHLVEVALCHLVLENELLVLHVEVGALLSHFGNRLFYVLELVT